jgi:hypothetical protein
MFTQIGKTAKRKKCKAIEGCWKKEADGLGLSENVETLQLSLQPREVTTQFIVERISKAQG